MNKNKRKFLTHDERLKIKAFIDYGYSASQIGRTIGRAQSVISREIKYGGGYKNYCIEVAEKKREELMQIRTEKINSAGNLSRMNYGKRVESLEMQLEILIDLVTQLQEKINGSN